MNETFFWHRARQKACWRDMTRPKLFPTLEADQSFDVVIVGAGITGLTAALRLLQAGRRVAVIEMHRVGDGATGSSTGHLDMTRDQTLKLVIDHFGQDAGRLMVQAGREALALIETWDGQMHLNCDFRRVPAYLYAEGEEGVRKVEAEFEAANHLFLEAELVREQILPFPVQLAVCYPHQARFNPLRYIQGLADALVAGGCPMFEETRMQDVEEGEPCRVRCNRGTLTAPDVLLTAHAPLMGLITIETRAHPYQSYVLAARVADGVQDALYWDTADPYHYVRQASSQEGHLLLVGGADHRTGEAFDTTTRFDNLEHYIAAHYELLDVEYRWSHEFFEPADGLPYIGRMPGKRHVYVATAFSGDGLKFGTVAGCLLSDQILGRDISEMTQLFDPARIKPIASAGRIIDHVGKAAMHWLRDRLRSGDVDVIEEIPLGEGAIVEVNGERLAVYRDEYDQFHAFSPLCRHAGGIVQWNSAAKTWDCPVHGGRYDALGHPIMAPPV
ncbi:MAG: FAD-dependent oxidoreductase, partial [Candidatus Hydrogenedentes bacterium]|nr:FAD-dependent oxidoreductase [Candidatus Hydrogenedentota bacterium]